MNSDSNLCLGKKEGSVIVFSWKGLDIYSPDKDGMCFVDACGEYTWLVPFEEFKKFVTNQGE